MPASEVPAPASSDVTRGAGSGAGSEAGSNADTATIALTINGESRAVPAGTTITGLIELLGLGGKRVAVERNKAIAPRATHAEVVLADGDRLELVTFVGGG